MLMFRRVAPEVDRLLAAMRVATTFALSENRPLPLGRMRGAYLAVTTTLLALFAAMELAFGRPLTAALFASVMISAIAIVAGSWWHVRTGMERSTLGGLWLAYASLILRASDDSPLEVASLRILAAAENSGPPRRTELDEVAAQMERATPARAAALAAYLELRAAAYDRAALNAAARTMRDPS